MAFLCASLSDSVQAAGKRPPLNLPSETPAIHTGDVTSFSYKQLPGSIPTAMSTSVGCKPPWKAKWAYKTMGLGKDYNIGLSNSSFSKIN